MNLFALLLLQPDIATRNAENTRLFELRRVEVPSGLPNIKGFSYLVPATWKSKGSVQFFGDNAITPAVGQFSFSSGDSTITGKFVVPFVAGLDAQPKPADYARLPSRIGKPGEATAFGFDSRATTQNQPPLNLSKYLYKCWKLDHPKDLGKVISQDNGPIEKSRFFGAGVWHTFTRHSVLKVRVEEGHSPRIDTLFATLDWIQLGAARQPLERGARGTWLFTEMGSFSAPEVPRHAYDQALEASILINGKVNGEFFLHVANLRAATLGLRPSALAGDIEAGGTQMSAGQSDAYSRLSDLSLDLPNKVATPQRVTYRFNDVYLELPSEFTRVWRGDNGTVLVATGRAGVRELIPDPDRWHELLPEPPGEG